MSRCFPYPPPGYEPRPRSEPKDLLKKERHKGKKHRKENGRDKGDTKGNDRRKGKDRDHKKLKREKHRERRKNKDRDKYDHQSAKQKTHKTENVDNRRPEERTKHEVIKDIKCSDELVAQFPGQGGHRNHKVNSTSELIPGSSKCFGAAASKEKEKSFSRKVKKSRNATQHYHGMIQKNDSNAYATGSGSQSKIKNGNLQVGSGEQHSSRRHSSKVKQMKRSGNVNDQNKVDDPMHLACLDKKKFACDDIKKRKELDSNSTLHENDMKTTKLPRMSPANITCVNGKASLHFQGNAPYSSTELIGSNIQEEWHKPQDGYSNGINGSRYSEQQKVSVMEGCLKPPHPDTKYLSQLLSIPPREDILECIDQDWLLSKDFVEWNTATSGAAEPHQVWSDAQLIDTADVIALPYVVPL